jgi:hypothetical protein
MNGVLTVRIKHSLSKQHMRGARLLAAKALEIESRGRPIPDAVLVEHRAYVTGSIMSAVAALEASVNELYLEVRDAEPRTTDALDERGSELMVGLWAETERLPILEKYQRALLFCGRPSFQRGQSPFQETDSVVKLRDNLVHYKPEWNDEEGRHESLMLRLKDKCPLNPIAEGELWFPHQCLSAGCASWSTQVAADFLSDFCARLGVPSRVPRI